MSTNDPSSSGEPGLAGNRGSIRRLPDSPGEIQCAANHVCLALANMIVRGWRGVSRLSRSECGRAQPEQAERLRGHRE